MLVHFHNVLISIEADTSEEAYSQLCTALSQTDMEFTTDTFSTDQNKELQSTLALFPRDE